MTAQHVRDLHTETTVDGYAQACWNGGCDHEDENCPAFPLSICDHCYETAGEPEEIGETVKWPCETIRALNQDHENPGNGPSQNHDMISITCKRDERDPEFCATHEDGMFDVEAVECDEAGKIADHGYLPVAGHPDDPECTHRSDGTDSTYCGRGEDEHAWSTR